MDQAAKAGSVALGPQTAGSRRQVSIACPACQHSCPSVSAVTCHRGTKPITVPSLTVTAHCSSAAHQVTHMHVVRQTLSAV